VAATPRWRGSIRPTLASSMDAAAVIERVGALLGPFQGPADEASVCAIQQEFSMDCLLECLAGVNAAQRDRLCALVERIAETPTGTKSLSGVSSNHLERGVLAESPRVRLMTTHLLGTLAASSESEGGACVAPLVALLADEDSGVAAAAARRLSASDFPLTLHATLFHSLPSATASGSATVRLRALDVASALAARSPLAREVVASIVNGLVHEVKSDDLLVALASCEALAAAVEVQAVAVGFGSEAMLALAGVVRDAHAEALLRERCLHVCSRIAASAVGGSAAQAAFAELALSCLQSQEALGAAALSACGHLCETMSGAECLLLSAGLAAAVCRAALDGASSSASTLAAMHTLASAAGAERPVDAELFSDQAEQALEAACHVAREPPNGLASSLWLHLRRRGDTFLEERIATYRLLSALGRRTWCCLEVCSHGELLNHLCDPSMESGHRARTWRLAALGALRSALRCTGDAHIGLKAKLESAARYARQGDPQVMLG
jgi:hypothetical protein